MMKKEAFVLAVGALLALLAVGIALSFGGFALISRGRREGWIAVALAAPMLFIAQRSMRVARTTIEAAEGAPGAPRAERTE